MSERIPAQIIETIDPRQPIRLTPSQAGGPIHTRSFSGRFRNLRLYGAGLLFLIFFGTAWLDWDGRQAVLWNLAEHRYYIFGATFWPQDFTLLSALLIIAAFGLFTITVVAGRVWCGYTCPQSVWTWVFMWAEKVTEGERNQRVKLDAAPWSLNKLARRSAKHAIWLGVSLLTALTFIGYFTPIRPLASDLLRLQLDAGTLVWVLFFMAATYLNAGWLREKVCVHMCPYSRFQSAMFDDDTLLVAYDAKRGEGRGPRRKDSDHKAEGLGDCIDCYMCVQVCPTGIDIRDGLQIDCISCGACIDACDSVMDKMGYARGLVGYHSERELQGGKTHWLRPRLIGYGIALVLMLAAFVWALSARSMLSIDSAKDRSMFRENQLGQIENTYLLKVINKTQQPQRYALSLLDSPGLRLDAPQQLQLNPGEILDVPVTVVLESDRAAASTLPVHFAIHNLADSREQAQTQSVFSPQAGADSRMARQLPVECANLQRAPTDTMKRYEKFADQIAELIRTGMLAPGEKVPSVRHASRTYGVSPSTVFQAYYLLEDRGLIQARARSGYFVRELARHSLAEPQTCQQPTQTTEVDVSELVFSVLASLKDPSTVPFGSAFPSPQLFPLPRLARSMAHSLRDMQPQAVIADMTEGNPNLRRQIALRYMVSGVMLPVEELVITSGAMEALNLCLQTVTQPGDLVAIEAPAFYACLQVLERLQLKAVEIPVNPREGIDLDVLSERLASLPIKACWFMSSLQNPLGASMSDDKKRALYELLQHHQVPLIEDDVYAELYFGSQPPKPVKSFDRDGLVMHCGSFSKCLAPGYRVGWVAGGRYAEQISRLKLMTTISPSVPAQAALADYLQHGGFDRHLRKLRHALEAQQASMLASAARHFPASTKVTRPSGGYFLWFEFPEQVDALRLFQLALAQGISLAPGPIFSATRRFGNCARLNYGHPWDAQSEQAMAMLGRILSSF